jgi:osmotically-inducible protein OsmY
VVAITRGDTVILRGVVEDLLDAQNVAAVAQYVEGVAEVIDELRVRTMQNGNGTERNT